MVVTLLIAHASEIKRRAMNGNGVPITYATRQLNYQLQKKYS